MGVDGLAALERSFNLRVGRVDRERARNTRRVTAAAFIAAYIGVSIVGHFPPTILWGLASIIAVVVGALLTHPSKHLVFLPEGIAETVRDKVVHVIPYGDIVNVKRAEGSVLVEWPNGSLELERQGAPEPFVRDTLMDDLYGYLDAKVSEARALADDRAAVTAYLERGDAGSAYRRLPPPKSALDAVARARVMPMELRLEAARALGDEAPELDISDELKTRRGG